MQKAVLSAAFMAFVVAGGISVAWTAEPGKRFMDDFSTPSDAWRFWNATLGHGGGKLALHPRLPEANLAGTAIHPDNLAAFTATVRWRFGKTGDSAFAIGWGKPYEWSPFEESQVRLSIDRQGLATLHAGKQTLGSVQLPPPDNGVFTLVVSAKDADITARGDRGDRPFSLPAGQKARSGYLTLRAERFKTARDEPVTVRSVQIDHAGVRPPLGARERRRELQTWLKDRLDRNEAVLQQFQAHIQAETAAGRWGYATDLAVRPGLVKVGEPVDVTFSAQGATAPVSKAHLEPDFLGAGPGPRRPLPLEWKSNPQGVLEARVRWTPDRPGNWRVVWCVGEERLSRIVAVVEPGYTVCRLLVTTHKGYWQPAHEPEVYDLIHQEGLAADFWDQAEWTSPFSRTPEGLLRHFRPLAAMRHRWGDRIMPMCNANWLIPGYHDTNLWHLDDSLQHEGIFQVRRLWSLLGLGPMEILASYTFGHTTPRIAQELGVKMLDSLVQWQNWRDGGDDNAWLINQWGAPTAPYFVARDDYRKVAPGKSIVAFTQATTSSVRIYHINTLEGQPQLSFFRRRAGEMGETANIDRFEATVDLWLAEAAHQAEPLFVSVGLENFVDLADWNEANRRGVRYLVEQARRKRLVFTSGADIADYYTRHYAMQPESWLFWPDLYAGLQASYKPKRVPDRIEIANAQFHCEHTEGVSLPRFFWDYTRPWSEAVWDDQRDIRKKFGLPDPELLTADNCVPRMVSLDGVRAAATIQRGEGDVTIRVTVDSSRALGTLPVAVWRVPLAAGSVSVGRVSPRARYVTVVDGSTSNVHGVLVCRQVPSGRSAWEVRLLGAPREPVEPGIVVGPHVRGRIFFRDAGPMAYLWLAEAVSPAGMLRVRVPEGRRVRLHDNGGHVQEATRGVLSVALDRAWQHESPCLEGLTVPEIQSFCTFEPGNP